MRIGDLARRTGATERSLRYYEQQLLLTATRTAGGHREYDDDAVQRVELIKIFLAAGVPTSGIRQMLPCAFSGTTTPAMIDRLLAERERIDRQAHELRATLERLDVIVEQAKERLVTPAA